MNGMMTGVVLDGMKTANGCVAETVSSFAFESSERVNVCELGHKSYSRHIPSEL